MPDVHSLAGVACTDLTVLNYSWASEFQHISIIIWPSQSSTLPLLRRSLSVKLNYTNSTHFFFLICIGLKWSCSAILEGRIESIKAPFLQRVTCMWITQPPSFPLTALTLWPDVQICEINTFDKREGVWTWDAWLFTAIRSAYSVKVPVFEFQKFKNRISSSWNMTRYIFSDLPADIDRYKTIDLFGSTCFHTLKLYFYLKICSA